MTNVGIKPGPKSRDWLRARLHRITGIRAFTLANGFVGEECKPTPEYDIADPRPWAWILSELDALRPTVRVNEGGAVTVRFHANHWLEIALRGKEVRA